MGQVALPQLLLVDMVVDIDCFLPNIAPQLLDELARHARAPEVGREPVPATVRREMILHAVRVRIVQSQLLGGLGDREVHAIAVQTGAQVVYE